MTLVSTHEDGCHGGGEYGAQAARLFTLRLWREELGGGRLEWRGSLAYLLTGEVRYFRDVDSLYRALLAVLDCSPPGPPSSTSGPA